ncbi:MAG: Y-family DNA polymerase [Legionellaceae bacterium]|nr:Y-family DNA polymerase [Legionellaceae bacterium]
MYALVDCNNFYASCERLFRPDLRNKPIIVLSNNDGCIIARSNEAKALGIAMGAPYFTIKALCKQHQVHVFSSNFPLYGDLSQRVMSVIKNAWPIVEQYSIDEAFINLHTMPEGAHNAFCHNLERQILNHTGIPTSIGIGPTKTLAKIANHLCKKDLKTSVFNINQQREWLKYVDVGDVWGVGKQWRKKLLTHGISTAADLAACHPRELKERFNVALLRTAMELQGINCCTNEEAIPRQSILSSKSFDTMPTEYHILAQALSSHAARAYEKLRNQHLLVKDITVFVHTNRFRPDLPQQHSKIVYKLIHPTDDLRLITQAAKDCLMTLYQPNFSYKKLGICFTALTHKNHQQFDLFHQPTDDSLQKKNLLMTVFDDINHKFGRHTIKLAAEGCHNKPMIAATNMRSPRYTTQWLELAVIRNGT